MTTNNATASGLRMLYEEGLRISSLQNAALRYCLSVDAQIDRLTEAVKTSGAMDGEFRIVVRFGLPMMAALR